MRVFFLFLKLGLMGFGGPPAHLALFHRYFVKQGSISEQTFAGYLTWASILPGPASSQVGMAIGYYLGGLRGALSAWLGFTLPISAVLIASAIYATTIPSDQLKTWLTPILVLTLVVVTQACWEMARAAYKTPTDLVLFAVAFACSQLWPTAGSAILIIGCAAYVGVQKSATPWPKLRWPTLNRYAAFFAVILLAMISLETPWAAAYRSGSFIFGGGHVALPFFQNEPALVAKVSNEIFWSGYGLTQSLPGPMFAFAGYLGALQGGVFVGVLTLIAIFLPGMLLMLAVITGPEINSSAVKAAMSGIQIAVVGLLTSALVPLAKQVVESGIWAIAGMAFAVAGMRLRIPIPILFIGFAGFGVLQNLFLV